MAFAGFGFWSLVASVNKGQAAVEIFRGGRGLFRHAKEKSHGRQRQPEFSCWFEQRCNPEVDPAVGPAEDWYFARSNRWTCSQCR